MPLPFAGILFPMSADIYYAEEIQSPYGNMIRRWVFDRTVKCSAISELVDAMIAPELKVRNKTFDYSSNIAFRIEEDIRKSSNGKYYPITAIAITNIKDPSGEPAWINGESLKYEEGATKTKYEIKTIVPGFDMFHNIGMYRMFLSRSGNQKWEEEL
jgi:hypothetical protein